MRKKDKLTITERWKHTVNKKRLEDHWGFLPNLFSKKSYDFLLSYDKVGYMISDLIVLVKTRCK